MRTKNKILKFNLQIFKDKTYELLNKVYQLEYQNKILEDQVEDLEIELANAKSKQTLQFIINPL